MIELKFEKNGRPRIIVSEDAREEAQSVAGLLNHFIVLTGNPNNTATLSFEVDIDANAFMSKVRVHYELAQKFKERLIADNRY